MTVAPADWVDVARCRSATWWLLSRLVTEQPQNPWLEELESTLRAVEINPEEPLGPESAALLHALQQAQGDAAGLTALAVDRTSLLAGILHRKKLPSPYESAALGQDMNGDVVMDVVRCYQEAGLTDFGLEFGPPDYLGTELRFMSVLAYQQMQAHQASDLGLAAQWLSMQRNFLETHLLNWVPEHCQRMADMAKTPFYRSAAVLIGAACELDHRDVLAIEVQLGQISHQSTAEVGACA
ncbi:MAG: hypothetical protein OHK0048_00800 [Rhodoferax sp.]